MMTSSDRSKFSNSGFERSLPPEAIQDLRESFSGRIFNEDDEEVSRHAFDAWPVAKMWQKQGKSPCRPGAVCYPAHRADLKVLLAWADKHGIALTPWGAGSSVTGACLSETVGVTVDFSEMNQVLELNETDRYVRVEPGIRGDRLEAWLQERGYTLNHSPQSLDRSTAGGWVATFATGQYSSRYGGIEQLLLGLTVILPDQSEVCTTLSPRSAAGPDLKHLFIGAEGTLGMTVELTLKIFPRAPFRRMSAFVFPDIASGLKVIREITQAGVRPFLVRLYDEDEAPHAMKDAAFRSCVLFLGTEGVQEVAESEFAHCRRCCAGAGAKDIGPGAVEAWMQRRFDFSSVERVLDRPGGYAETIEVAHFWSGIGDLHTRLKSALHPLADEVVSHFSHVYDQGTSMYVILFGQAATDSEAEQRLRTIWRTTLDICLETGATVTHHHGAGLARRDYIRRERSGDHHLLQAIKRTLDPRNRLNPGKLDLA